MIPRHTVTTTIADTLDGAVDFPVYRGVAPDPAPASYAVVTFPPGSTRLGGLACPEAGLQLRVDLRTVATAANAAMAERECERLADLLLTAALTALPGLRGDRWAITGREITADSGVTSSAVGRGVTANNVATLTLLISPQRTLP